METGRHIQPLGVEKWPELIAQMTDPPEKLYARGTLPPEGVRYLCVVGSRQYTPYGKEVCERLLGGLSGYPICIVSGLALGIDGVAHRSALNAGLHTIAVPGSGLSEEVLYPRSHIGLAREIVSRGGCLLSEFEPSCEAAAWLFPKRNRLMAGMSHATLVIEASERSGTLITARLALSYDRDVLVVPGSIFAHSHQGAHGLLRQGAQVITRSEDILDALHIHHEEQRPPDQKNTLTETDMHVLRVLSQPRTLDEIIRLSSLPAHTVNASLSKLEIDAVVAERLGKFERRV